MHPQKYVRKLTMVAGHPTLRALAEVEWHGLIVRGLKLEFFPKAGWRVGPPGRLLKGQWQMLFSIEKESVQDELTQLVLKAYLEGSHVAA